MGSDQQQWDIVSSVGLTALGVAAARAVASRRDEPLIDDPYAHAFVRAADPPVPMPTSPEEAGAQGSIWVDGIDAYLAIRTRYFDQYFSAARVEQAVILAAGLDTRSYRLHWAPSTTVFEVDQPKVLEFKQHVLDEQGATPSCDRRAVPMDLRDDWAKALVDAGFDATRPTAWLAEGLLPYLPAEAEQQLMETIDGLSAPGSRASMEDFSRTADLIDDEHLAEARKHLGVDMRELLHFDDRPEPADVLAGLGWDVTTDTADAVAAEYGRPLPEVFPRNGGTRFVTASKPPR